MNRALRIFVMISVHYSYTVPTFDVLLLKLIIRLRQTAKQQTTWKASPVRYQRPKANKWATELGDVCFAAHDKWLFGYDLL